MDKNIKVNLKLLDDSPILRDQKEYYDFYHQYVSPAIHDILNNPTKIETIGLFGSWGSGKSTIIKNLEADYSKEYPVFVFDAWKYKDDPLRRTFLINLFNYIDDRNLWAKGKKLSKNCLDVLYESSSTEEKIKQPKEQLISKNNGITKNIRIIIALICRHIVRHLLLYGLILIALSWLILQIRLGESNPLVQKGLILVGYISQSASVALMFGWIAKQVIEKLVDKFFSDLEEDIKTQTIIKKRDYLNSSEQFEEKFIELVQALNQKIVIVFDNIDRVQGDIAIQILSSIKTFIDPKKNSQIVFIVPCDSTAIVSQIKKYYSNTLGFDPLEYLRKLFNVIIWTPDFIGTDLEDFTKKQIKQLGKDHSLLDNDDVVLVITQAFKSNPREIKQFINNLVSQILIVSQTEVWDLVKENIAYLAKVLVLRQKFPDSYKDLRAKWYDPERIYDQKLDQNLRDFMVNTSTITVSNAEPFLYFKKPNQIREIKDSENLTTALLKADTEKSMEIISKNKGKKEEVANFILSLYSQYKIESIWITNIFITQVIAFRKLSISVENITYFNRSLEVIDRYLWMNYLQLPTKDIFATFIGNKKTKASLRNKIISKYVTAIGSKEVIKNNIFAKEIIENLIDSGINIQETLDLFKRHIEENYSLDSNILGLFNNISLQRKFITVQTIEKYINPINNDNFTKLFPLLVVYKEFIKENNLSQNCISIINKIIPLERTQNLSDNPNKQILFETIGELFEEPNSIAYTPVSSDLATLGNNILAAYKSLGSAIDSKYYFISVLYLIKPFVETAQAVIVDNSTSEFIRTADVNTINDKVLPKFKEINKLSEFITQNLSAIKNRAITLEGEFLGGLYTNASPTEQQSIINYMIAQRADLGRTFIQSLKEIPNRQETLQNMLQRVDTIPIPSRQPYYDWIASQTKQTDDSVIKQNIVSHITSMLKTDDPITEETGYHLFNKAKNILSDTAQREIAKEIIEWFRTPGKIIISNNRFALKSVAIVFNDLQITLKADFVYVIFNLLTDQVNRQSIEVGIEILREIKPKWSGFQKDFIDYKEKIINWTNIENKNYVISELLKLHQNRPSKTEKAFWIELNKLVTPITVPVTTSAPVN